MGLLGRDFWNCILSFLLKQHFKLETSSDFFGLTKIFWREFFFNLTLSSLSSSIRLTLKSIPGCQPAAAVNGWTQCCHFPCYNTNPVFLSWPPCWEFLLRVVTRNPKFPCFQRIPKKSSIFDQKLGIFVKKYVFSAKIFHSKSLIKIFFLKFVFSNGKIFCHKFWKKFVTFLQL